MNSKLANMIQRSSNQFSKVDILIANFVNEQPQVVLDLSISELAKELYISKASITRFCVKIGLPGFKEFKYLLSLKDEEVLSDSKGEIESLIGFFQEDYAKIISGLKFSVNEKSIKKAAQSICDAKNIFILGIASSGYMAKELSWRLLRLGLDARAITEPDYMTMVAGIANPNDLFIVITKSGETKVICDTLLLLKENKIKTICITEFSKSKATKNADLVLLTPRQNNVALSESISNLFGLILVTDILCHYIFIVNPSRFNKIYNRTIISHEQSTE